APPWADAALNPCSERSWQLVRWPADGRCYPIFQRGPCDATQELVWDASAGRPACACPAGHLHHAASARCYRHHTRGPCPRRHFFAEDAASGAATCRRFAECRPGEIFWPADGRCHAHLTRGPCGKGELLALNRLTLEPECGCSRRQMARSYWPTRGVVECACHARMLENYDARTGQCFPQGGRGPCPPGNTFAFNNATRRTECRCPAGSLVRPETGACHRAFTQGPCPRGRFASPRPGAPHQAVCVANPCQRGELYFPDDGFCHRIGRRGPCPAGQLVQYEAFRGVSYRGACGCTEHFTQNYWPADGRCYEQHTRGPCPARLTFVYNATSGRTECQCAARRGAQAAVLERLELMRITR
ncbi:uncharacterized protein LOC119091542, partial [Pollicipes pollicipes]|uniref:uncharacterized protein LOC119091542 n=1 Tax=Pollicipes pollicipes TaxID=41117 RepID=UPI0018855A8D